MKTFGSMQGDSRYKPYFCVNYTDYNSYSPEKIGLKLNTAYWIRKKEPISICRRMDGLKTRMLVQKLVV